ncbi:MAG: hypothetical protein J2P19_11035 [Pseudonocardia sp.]|nr:hypothetical protein [Pseudonocardia sp.]
MTVVGAWVTVVLESAPEESELVPGSGVAESVGEGDGDSEGVAGVSPLGLQPASSVINTLATRKDALRGAMPASTCAPGNGRDKRGDSSRDTEISLNTANTQLDPWKYAVASL